MAPSMRALLPLALVCCQAAALTTSKPRVRTRTKTLVATMVFPDDEIPVDLMMEHHLRMVSSNMSILQGAIIDNRPPWGEMKSNQEPLLGRYRRSQDGTGVVRVKRVDYSNLSTLITRFFSSEEISLHAKTVNLAADMPTNVSKLDEKANAARMLGMLNFLELCADAEADVDLCIYMDSTTFVHRSNDTGIVEQAVKVFQQNPQAVVLNPPDMCTYTKATQNSVCKAGNVTSGINHGFFVVNRDRFEGFAPMPVESVGLGSVFEELLAEGLTKGGVEGPVKQIRCGGAFAIHPYDTSLGRYACSSQRQLGLSAHSQAATSRAGSARDAGIFSEDYARFPGGGLRAKGLAALIERFEAGKFPEAKPMDSLTNKCNNMCPSKERIRDGLAW
ncbi:unnamed protein product [Prorocentrum cordatum]|uniref:Uncharacterized protein n=1 Tax=Prorocentrum cordatum TaxID=2364126 RepID=A0ABN9TU05_9DINO|nr:unnamed protein product [Polarella glacialis]